MLFVIYFGVLFASFVIVLQTSLNGHVVNACIIAHAPLTTFPMLH